MTIQTEAAECGLACLSMIAAFHGYESDMAGLRRRFRISSQGTNLKNLMDIAARLQLSSRALRLEPEHVRELRLPCILHWGMNHFVVLQSVRGKRFAIHDPAVGRQVVNRSTFDQHFTGVALELTPTNEFEPARISRKLRLGHFWSRINGLGNHLVKILLLSLLLQLFAVVTPFFLQTVVDEVILRGDDNLLIALALGFGLLLLIQTATNTLRDRVILYASSLLNIQMAANLFHHLVRLPMNYFSTRHMGDVISRFGSLHQVRELLSTGLVAAVVDGLMGLITLAAMCLYNVKLAIISIIFVLLYATLRVILFRPLRQLSEEKIVAQAKHDSHFMETVRAIQTIKLHQRENDRQGEWQNCLASSINKHIRINRWTINYNAANQLLFGLENILVIYFAATAVMENTMSVGMLYAYISYKSRFMESMDALIIKLVEFKMLALHLDRLADIIFTRAEDVDLTASLLSQDEPSNHSLKGKIEVRKLGYRYGEADAYIFRNVSFTINPGETVSIVGPSGCGKTTLLKCLMGLVEPSEGEILVDDLPIGNTHSYRQQIAGVMQDDQLLAGSLAENIACFDQNPDFERVIACAHTACIHEDISRMPMQYNTLVGDMGGALSGGQKQRIILARALYRSPRILFMDEATSHLDMENERTLNDRIRNLAITRILVAHRPETIESATRKISLPGPGQ
ncbi:peptidase domain-containing ABC transporter [Haliea sp. E17]|uniref:peptidase domain-containing ABC transporter n=1 Tax=Haliea sp. E17 TaxID=3401576 RepID=UPI003AAC182D